MICELKKIIAEYRMFSPGEKVLVGLSGGPDSVCLLYLLNSLSKEYGLKLFIAHLNHGLRGRESDGDEKFCKELGERLEIPVFSKKIKLSELGGSSENTARKERFKFFLEEACQCGAKKIALAHTADDQAETVLMRIVRGAGVDGLSGIPPTRNMGDVTIIRPLLSVRKDEILKFLKGKGIEYRTDRTNKESVYFRNKVRNKLLPELEKYNPSINDSLRNIGEISALANDFIGNSALREFKKCAVVSDRGVRIQADRIGGLHPIIVREIIRMSAESVGEGLCLNSAQIEDVVNLLKNTEGTKRVILGKDIFTAREYNELVFCRETAKSAGFRLGLPVPGKTDIPNTEIVVACEVGSRSDPLPYEDRNLFEVGVDCDKIQRPIVVRSREKGDKMRPIGLKGTKKLQDIFVDLKIPEKDRDKIPIFVSRDEIFWIPGYRIGERFKVDRDTKRVLLITVKGMSI